ncbi:MAG: MmgE/PrpD family protein [Stappiaceae bacterium]
MNSPLLEYIEKTTYSDLSDRQIEFATHFLIDYLGVTLGGSDETPCKLIQQVAENQGKEGHATVFGTGLKLNAASAALCNGIASHVLDWDDAYTNGFCHLGSFIFSPALALAEDEDVTFEDFITAVCIAYEAGIRIADLQVVQGNAEKNFAKGMNISATIGTVTGTIASAKLLKLPAHQIDNAIGLAVNMSSGVLKGLVETDVDYIFGYHHAWGSHGAVMAALVAKTGFEADKQALFGRYGYLHVFGAHPEHAESVDELDFTEDLIGKSSLKRHPACAFVLNPLTALFECVSDNGIDFSDITHCDFSLNEISYYESGVPRDVHDVPGSSETARLSIQFCVASAILDGQFDLESTSPAALSDPRKKALSKSIGLEIDKEMSDAYRDDYPVRIRLGLKNGQTYEHFSQYYKGYYLHPMTDEEVALKYLDATQKFGHAQELLTAIRKATGASVREILSVC